MTDVHPRLVALAEQLQTVADVATDSQGRSWTVQRCPDCQGAIIPADTEGRLAHLMTSHGWRMDGRRWDSKNRLLEVL